LNNQGAYAVIKWHR